ncbi:hypothetical protein Q8G71_36360, partial [Klebsiella pneumoniae]
MRNPPPMPDMDNLAKIYNPPLEKPNPGAWLSYDGWVLDYRVLGVMAEGQQIQLDTPQAAAFRDAVAKWAGEAGVD